MDRQVTSMNTTIQYAHGRLLATGGGRSAAALPTQSNEVSLHSLEVVVAQDLSATYSKQLHKLYARSRLRFRSEQRVQTSLQQKNYRELRRYIRATGRKTTQETSARVYMITKARGRDVQTGAG